MHVLLQAEGGCLVVTHAAKRAQLHALFARIARFLVPNMLPWQPLQGGLGQPVLGIVRIPTPHIYAQYHAYHNGIGGRAHMVACVAPSIC